MTMMRYKYEYEYEYEEYGPVRIRVRVLYMLRAPRAETTSCLLFKNL